MRQTTSENPSFREVARLAAEGLRRGTLTLKDVLSLTAIEINAIRKLAEQHEQRGNPAAALKLQSALAACDPYNAAHWKAMAELHMVLGSPAGALLCYETVAAIRGRDAESARRQADCLEQLGFVDGPRQVRKEARHLPGNPTQEAQRLGHLKP